MSCGSVKNFSVPDASNASRSARSATRTTSTSGFATRGLLGWTRSYQIHVKPLRLSLTTTSKAKRSSFSTVPGRAETMRRTSSWSAVGPEPRSPVAAQARRRSNFDATKGT